MNMMSKRALAAMVAGLTVAGCKGNSASSTEGRQVESSAAGSPGGKTDPKKVDRELSSGEIQKQIQAQQNRSVEMAMQQQQIIQQQLQAQRMQQQALQNAQQAQRNARQAIQTQQNQKR